MLVDAHCHLTGSHLPQDQLKGTMDRAFTAGVTGFIAVGTDFEDSRAVLALARDTPCIQASIGVHPHEAKGWNAETGAELETMALDPRVRFIGETGLDWHYDLSPREEQERAFRAQIQLAKRVRKPLMIHTRSAPEATLRTLWEEGAEEVSGIIHCFSEDLAFAEGALDLGFYLSFSGIVTFKNAHAIREVATWAPEDRILVETDSPYLAPVPHRGKTNEPAYVRFIADFLAQARGVSSARIEELTTQNLEALCGWAPPA